MDESMLKTTEAFGRTLGLITREGMPAVKAATEALSEGEATPRQQRICYELLKALQSGY